MSGRGSLASGGHYLMMERIRPPPPALPPRRDLPARRAHGAPFPAQRRTTPSRGHRWGTAVPGLLRPRSPGRVERLCGRALVRTTVTAIQLLYRLADHCGVKLARTPRSRSSSAAASCTSRHDSLRAARPRGDRRAAAGITTAHVLSSATPPPRAPGSPPTRTSSDPWSLAGDPARDVHLGIGSEGRRGAAAARSAGRGPAHRSRTDTCPIACQNCPPTSPSSL